MTHPELHLVAENLACVRGGVLIFEAVSFELCAGMVLNLRGPNGAGKTSLLRMLAGLIPPAADGLMCRVDGIEVSAARAQLAHFIGHRGALTAAAGAQEDLTFHTTLLGGDLGLVPGALERVGLGIDAARRVGLLSAGQQKRLSLARLLTAPRPLWLLDEPAEFLDANGRELLQAMVVQHCAAGGLVVAATHGASVAEGGVELRLAAMEVA